MLEVFTIGGGEYLVNTFNAVAAWTGGGGYRSMLQVVFVMGLAYSLFVVAFSLDWRAWLNWFIQATAIYMMLLVPTVTVKITDRIDPGLAPATVANVPVGLAAMASFTSQFGDWMTRTAETVLVMPAALQMTDHGMIYGARLMEKAQTFQITDPVFRANLDEHFKQCVFYDVLLGLKDMETLTTADNLWASIGVNASPARAQKWLARSGGGTVDSTIIPCNEAYQRLDGQWNAEIDQDLPIFAKTAFPKLIDTVAAQRMRDDLPQVAAAMHGTSGDAYSYLQQVSTIEAFLAARESFTDAGWDAYAAQRADAQARNTYTSIAQQAMTWVPLLGIVLSVVFYAMFPVIFPLFLFPRTGIPTLKGYATGFFYLASWGPLYVVLHMFVMNRAANAYAAVSPSGPTLLVIDGIQSVNGDIATIAGFLMMSVPFLAAGMAKGAMAVASHATSMLAPAQGAAEAAAIERTTGNYAYGNTSFQNLTSNTRQANKWDDRPSFASGFSSSSFMNADGGYEYQFADGTNAFDTRQAISSLAFTPSRSAAFGAEARKVLSEGQGRVDQTRAAASEAWTATASTATDLVKTASQLRSSSTETGSGLTNSLANMNEISNGLTQSLQEKFGLTTTEADRISRVSILSGSADVMAGIPGIAGISAKIAAQATRDTGRTITADEAFSQLQDYVSRETNSTQARAARDDFMRRTSSSTDSEVRSLSQRLGVSVTDARSATREASQTEETYRRISNDVSESEARGYALNFNDTQEFVTFAQEELLKSENAILSSNGWHPGAVMPKNEQQAQVRDILLERFMNERIDHMREELGVSVPDRLKRSLHGPSITTADGIRAWGSANALALAGDGPDVAVQGNSGNSVLAQEVSGRVEAGEARIGEGAMGLRADRLGAHLEADRLGGSVDARNHASLGETMPVLSPLIEGAGRVIEDIGDSFGGGGGHSQVVPLSRGGKAHLACGGYDKVGDGRPGRSHHRKTGATQGHRHSRSRRNGDPGACFRRRRSKQLSGGRRRQLRRAAPLGRI